MALDCDVASVCIKPYAVPLAREILAGSDVKVGTIVGFPHGNSRIDIKLREARAAMADGAEELDLVVNIGKVLGGDWVYVSEEIGTLNEAVVRQGAILKVIFENAYLNDDQKIRLCEICSEVGADFVKTSTGYAEGGATIEDLKLMRKHSPPHVQVKAAGGVHTLDRLLEIRELGVTRVGATRTVMLLEDFKKRYL